MRIVSAAPGPGRARVRPHRPGDQVAPRRAAPAARRRGPAAPGAARRWGRRSRRRRHRVVPVDLRRLGDLREHRLLAGMPESAVPLGRPAARAAEGEHRRVLSGAVVLELRGLGPALEVVLGGGRLCEQAAHRRELLGARQVRGAGERDLRLVEVGRRARREAPGSASRSAEERDEARIPGDGDHLSLRHRDRVHAVAGLDDSPRVASTTMRSTGAETTGVANGRDFPYVRDPWTVPTTTPTRSSSSRSLSSCGRWRTPSARRSSY